MLYCEACDYKFEFEDAREIREYHTDRHYETWTVCPRCKSTDLDDMRKCPCGEMYVDDGKAFCPKCEKIALRSTQKLIEILEMPQGDAIELIDHAVSKIERGVAV